MAYNYQITNPCSEIFLHSMTLKEFHILAKDTIVDGEKWYTAIVGNESARWIRIQDECLWAEVGGYFSGSVFDIHHELLLIMKLKWPS